MAVFMAGSGLNLQILVQRIAMTHQMIHSVSEMSDKKKLELDQTAERKSRMRSLYLWNMENTFDRFFWSIFGVGLAGVFGPLFEMYFGRRISLKEITTSMLIGAVLILVMLLFRVRFKTWFLRVLGVKKQENQPNSIE
jgi:hypothetical protein